nr:hypothetical protein [uncultured Flavobacterium sp.]
MKKTIILYILILCSIQITSCQRQKNKVSKSNKKKEKVLNNIDFLNYPVDDLEGITGEGNVGVYRNFDFDYRNGEALFILIPKIGAEKWSLMTRNKYSGKEYEIDDKISKDLSKRSFKDLSKDFNIWVFYTDKKYLEKTPNMDSPYSAKIPRRIDVYFLNDKLNKWSIVNSFSLENKNDEVKENRWREDFIGKIVAKSNSLTTKESKESTKILLKWQGVYQREFSEKFSDGTYSLWTYYFIINGDKIILKSDNYPGESEYKVIEQNNQLDLFESDSTRPNFKIKEEDGKFYIQGDSFENNNTWLLFEKKTK